MSSLKLKAETLDFDEEARVLWKRLNIDPNSVTPGINSIYFYTLEMKSKLKLAVILFLNFFRTL